MDRRRFLAAGSALATTGLAGCLGGGAGGGGADGDGETAADTPSGVDADAIVALEDTAFVPVEAAVPVGATVAWVNRDAFDHDVTAAGFTDAAASWDLSVTLGAGETASHTFAAAGVYEYYCTIHGKGSMCGVVVVGDASYDGGLPCRSDDRGGYSGY